MQTVPTDFLFRRYQNSLKDKPSICLLAIPVLTFLMCLLAPHLTHAETWPVGEWAPNDWSGPQVLFERIEKIYSDGKWNGRPVIFSWKNKYHLFIRTGSGHGSSNGSIRLITTEINEPRQWSTSPYTPKNYQATVAAGRSLDPIGPGPLAQEIIETELNEQEVHILVTPDRLFAYTVIEEERPRTPSPKASYNPVPGTMVCYSDDGIHWTEPEFVFAPGWSFWKPRSYQGVYYVAADIMSGDARVDLLKSTDGFSWEVVSTMARAKDVKEGMLTETDLLFLPDGTLLAVTRQGRMFRSDPPYTKWTSRKWATSLQGPALELVGDTVLASGRIMGHRYPDDQNGSRRNGLFIIDPETLERKWQMNMPTQWGADVSYPHMFAMDHERAVIVWYDGVWPEPAKPHLVKQSDIMLAVLRVVK